jgi:macrolide transport system ATP-binding/permease protein
MMEKLLQDVLYSFGMMIRSPGFVAVAVISLALGIGANTMIFSLVNALLLKPLSVDKPDQLTRIFRVDEYSPYHSLSYPDYLDYLDRQQAFSGIAAGQRMMMSLNIDGRPEVMLGAVVSANFFSVLGVQLSSGRVFAPAEDRSIGAHPVAIISYSLWRRRFNADPALLGKSIKLNGYGFTIVGIAAKGVTGIDNIFATEIWIPIAMYPKLIASGAMAFDPAHGREETWLNDVVGRLKPGVGVEQAQADLNGISAQLESTYPSRQTNQRRGIALVPLSKGDPEMRTAILSFVSLLMAVVGLVLLIACANVANLLLTRAAARQREIAIRQAMGANRWRLIRQLLTESVVLAMAGGVASVILAFWASDLLLAFKPSVSIPMTVDLSLDLRVLGFCLVTSVLTGIAFGLAPALQSSRSDLVSALKARTVSSSRGFWGARLHSLLVVAQMSLSLVLLIGAALLLRSMQNAYQIDPGFEKKNLVLLSTDLDLHGYTADEGRHFYQQLLDRARSLPRLRSASLTSLFPLSLGSSEAVIVPEGRESQSVIGTSVGTTNVAPEYFVTIDIPLIQGREFDHHDTEASPKVAIINQTMASQFWPGENALGKRIKVDPLASQSHYYEVVGIVKDSKFGSLGESPRPFMYRCILQEYSPSLTLLARTESNPEGMLAVLRREVQSLDDALPVYDVKTVTEHLTLTLFPLRMASTLLGLLGAIALLLASVGLYAVIAYSVTLRTRDYGIRMALGAKPVQVLSQVLVRGMVLAMIGVVIGLVLALVMTRAMSSLGLLYGISAIDPLTFFVVPLVLVFVAVLASYLPARRATKIDPIIALRQE